MWSIIAVKPCVSSVLDLFCSLCKKCRCETSHFYRFSCYVRATELYLSIITILFYINKHRKVWEFDSCTKVRNSLSLSLWKRKHFVSEGHHFIHYLFRNYFFNYLKINNETHLLCYSLSWKIYKVCNNFIILFFFVIVLRFLKIIYIF